MNDPQCLSSICQPEKADSPWPAKEHHANVHIPLPLINGVGVLATVGLAVEHPLTLPLPLPWPRAFILATSLMIVGWAYREFGRSHNPVPPNQPAPVLMTGGPFRYWRNPLDLALAPLHVGLALASGNAWLLTLAPTLLVVRYRTISREEAYSTR